MRPIVNGLEGEYGDRIDFRRYNIITDEGNAWATEYGLRGHPAFLLVNEQGQEQWRYVGVVPEETMETALMAALLPGKGE